MDNHTLTYYCCSCGLLHLGQFRAIFIVIVLIVNGPWYYMIEKTQTSDSNCHEPHSNSYHSHKHHRWISQILIIQFSICNYFQICPQFPNMSGHDVSINVSCLPEIHIQKNQKLLNCSCFMTEEVELILLWFACQGAKITKKKTKNISWHAHNDREQRYSENNC